MSQPTVPITYLDLLGEVVIVILDGEEQHEGKLIAVDSLFISLSEPVRDEHRLILFPISRVKLINAGRGWNN